MQADAFLKSYTIKQLQQDFMQLRNILERKHPNLYRSREELCSIFDKQYGLLRDGMTELEFYRVLAPITAALGCGHTNVYASRKLERYMQSNGKYLPMHMKVIDNKLYVIDNQAATAIPTGVEVISINGRRSSDIIHIMLECLSADGYNQSKKRYIMNHWFNALYYYFIESSEEFCIEYCRLNEETVYCANVQAIQNHTMHMTTMSIHFQKPQAKLFGSSFCQEYALLAIPSFQISFLRMGEYKEYIKNFFIQLREAKAEQLIIDLRGNWGGSPAPAVYLFSYLLKEAVPYFEEAMFFYSRWKKPIRPAEERYSGNLYILMDGASFSTTGHLLSLLRHHGIGVFLGEESGGGAISTAFGSSIVLKNTRLRAYCAKLPFRAAAAVQSKGRGIMPDYVVENSLQDYIDKRDAQLEAALRQIKGLNVNGDK